MLTQLTIPKKSTQLLAMDSQQLYAIGLKHIQKLSSQIWTDYNVHDSGITTLEYLCYALTDLSYRASFAIADLLASESDNAREMSKQFFTARQILPNRALTLLDYRKLLIDIEGVKNAWVQPAPLSYYADTVNPSDPENFFASPRLSSVALFVDEITDLASLSTKLSQPSTSDRVSQYISKKLSNQLLEALKAEASASEDEKRSLTILLVQALNGIIQETIVLDGVPKGVSLYDRARFDDVPLSEPTRRLLEQKIREADIERLNRLLLEDVYGAEILKNQWLRDKSSLREIEQVDIAGLYAVKIEYENPMSLTKLEVIQSVKSKLQANRNLCEDFVAIAEVETQSFQLCAELELSPDADVERVKADIISQVQEYLSPTIKFYSLSQMLAQKKPDGTAYTVDEIFDGPALDSGFMDDDELENADLLTEIRLSDIISVIMDIKGVQAVRDIVINPEGNKVPLANKWVIPVDMGKQANLKTETSRLVFYKRNMPIVPSGIGATPLVRENTEKQINDLPIPLGKFRSPDSYYSFQNHFPEIYGLHEVGLSSNTNDKRKALALQLKAYLLFYDQIMANYMAQLSQVKELFSMKPDLRQTYAYQVVNSFAEFSKIYAADDPITTLQAQNHDREEATGFDRRNRFLDHLIARFAERVNDLAYTMYANFGTGAEDIIRYKCGFLEDYPTISSDRALAYDYSLTTQTDKIKDLWDSENVSGLEKRLTKLLGFPNHQRRNLSDSEEEGMYLIENILLRPEQSTDPFLPICPSPNCNDCAEADPYSYRIHIILPAYGKRLGKIEFRRFAEAIIREETPAHILPKVCWINKEDMAKLEKLYRDWIYLKAGVEESSRASKLMEFIKELFTVKNIYPQPNLSDCDSGENQPKFMLGQTALGTQKKPET